MEEGFRKVEAKLPFPGLTAFYRADAMAVTAARLASDAPRASPWTEGPPLGNQYRNSLTGHVGHRGDQSVLKTGLLNALVSMRRQKADRFEELKSIHHGPQELRRPLHRDERRRRAGVA